jgi:hypothetical protein
VTALAWGLCDWAGLLPDPGNESAAAIEFGEAER